MAEPMMRYPNRLSEGRKVRVGVYVQTDEDGRETRLPFYIHTPRRNMAATIAAQLRGARAHTSQTQEAKAL